MSTSISNPMETVIAVLKERDLPVKKEVIESAFANEGDNGENSRWVEEHLNWETLLSKDEYTQYMKLESSGSWKQILQDPVLDATRPVLDHDMQSAIAWLKTSTATIQKQTETLQLQCEALEKQSRSENDRCVRRTRHLDQLGKKHGNARQHLNVATADLVEELDQTVKSESELATAGGKRILANTAARLKQDDKVLGHLESLVVGSQSMTDDASIVRRVEDLASTLSRLVSEEIHCRLDRLYLEAMQTTNAEDNNDLSHDDREIYSALQAELESLYPEIDVLAEMSVKQQFGDPVVREIQQRRDQSHNVTQKNLEDALDTMADMITDTQMLSRQLQARQSFCETLRALIALYQLEAATAPASAQPSRRQTIRRSIPNSLEISTTTPSGSQALDSLLRRLGSSSKAVFQSPEGVGGAHALYEKRTQLAELLCNLAISAESPLNLHLGSTDQAMQQLSAALFADSHFGTSLTDVEQEGRLAALDAQLRSLQKGIEGLDVDAIHRRDKGREKFLDRWS